MAEMLFALQLVLAGAGTAICGTGLLMAPARTEGWGRARRLPRRREGIMPDEELQRLIAALAALHGQVETARLAAAGLLRERGEDRAWFPPAGDRVGWRFPQHAVAASADALDEASRQLRAARRAIAEAEASGQL